MRHCLTVGLLIFGLSALAVSSAAPPQAVNPAARDILRGDRPLLKAEIAVVLEAARRAVSGKTLRLAYTATGPGPEVLMGNNGRPRVLRLMAGDAITFIHYTGAPARSCGGAALDGELVVEYERRSGDDRWTATARTRTSMEVTAAVFDMLAGGIALESGDRTQIGTRSARAVIAPWKPPQGAQADDRPVGATQALWIDIESLLPLRWSISVPSNPARGTPGVPDYSMSFIYDSTSDLTPPELTVIPACVP